MSTNKEVQDKLSWNNINQLHEAVSNFSKQSFDIKKLWITVEVSVITILVTLDVKDLRFVIIVSGAVLVFFYLLDCMTYYYQDKLRERMNKEQNAIRLRNGIGMENFNRKGYRIFRSILNWSHLLYYSVGLILIASFLYVSFL